MRSLNVGVVRKVENGYILTVQPKRDFVEEREKRHYILSDINKLGALYDEALKFYDSESTKPDEDTKQSQNSKNEEKMPPELDALLKQASTFFSTPTKQNK